MAKAKPGAGMILVRGLETAAACAIILFGVLLLTGYMVSERMGLFYRDPAKWGPAFGKDQRNQSKILRP